MNLFGEGGTVRSELKVMAPWLLSRLAILIVAWSGPWFLGAELTDLPRESAVARWNQWDVSFYSGIAIAGYNAFGNPPNIAFLPGLPFLLWLLHEVGFEWVSAGLVISFIAGLFAARGLAHLCRHYAPGMEETAVLFLATAPSTVFLSAGYPEATFLALAVWCWHYGLRGRWFAASGLAAISLCFRVNGLFLAVALLVLWFTSSRRSKLDALIVLGLPLLTLFAWMAFLHSLTGDWLAWQHAQSRGWMREFVGPIRSLETSWAAAFQSASHPQFAWFDSNHVWMARAELVAVLVGVLTTLRLLTLRWWAEATYVFLPIFSLATSTWYFSVPRSLIVAWPLYVLMAFESRQRPWLKSAWLTVFAPLAVLFTAGFLVKRWVG